MEIGRCRANKAYRFLARAELGGGDYQAVRELLLDPDFGGLLVAAPDQGLSTKAISVETSRLFVSLSEPKVIECGEGEGGKATLSRERLLDLVFSGVFEIEHQGAFKFGPTAMEALGVSAKNHVSLAPDRIQALSRAAIEYGQDLHLSDPLMLSARMYFFGRRPISPTVCDNPAYAKFPLRFLAAVLSHFNSSEAVEVKVRQGWFLFKRKGANPSGACRHKLYISPQIEDLPYLEQELAKTLVETATMFKIASDVRGLMRPDKLLAYFATRENLLVAAGALRKVLVGARAHGVPFTGSLMPDGMLSWGIDPPTAKFSLSWLEQESWRLWVTNRLASSLILARRYNGEMSPYQFAISRMRADGVDADNWAPTAQLAEVGGPR